MRTSRWSLYLDHVQPVIGCHPCVSSPSCQSRNAAIEIAIRGMSAPPSYMSLMALTSPAEATRKDAACRHPVTPAVGAPAADTVCRRGGVGWQSRRCDGTNNHGGGARVRAPPAAPPPPPRVPRAANAAGCPSAEWRVAPPSHAAAPRSAGSGAPPATASATRGAGGGAPPPTIRLGPPPPVDGVESAGAAGKVAGLVAFTGVRGARVCQPMHRGLAAGGGGGAYPRHAGGGPGRRPRRRAGTRR